MKILDRLLWTTDEDGERVHRLKPEWDGDKSPSWQRCGYRAESDQWDLCVGTTWSCWRLSIEAGWTRESAWSPGTRWVAYRRQGVLLAFGPWCLAWMRCKPLEETS